MATTEDLPAIDLFLLTGHVASLKTLEAFMHEKLGRLEKPVNVDEMVDLRHLPR